ncbi:MAG: DUF3943 domain-containing protein [Candidatus Azobacteroides sp.]|nr:DUF3943 domain-containing protein [Candidatus Azobacteroides sp.]
MKKKYLLFLLFIILLFSVSLNAQLFTPVNKDLSRPVSFKGDTVPKKNWLQAGAITFGLNIGLWAHDRYIQKGDFSYISWHTIKENFKHGFIWDNDYMGTNMFLHPYNGSLYFIARRANGLNYWESGGLALAGSAMWELFMECEYPSTNDIIATPIGGMAIGEFLFRSSDLILDDRKTGFTRFGLEFASFIVAPTRGITRILNGEAWRKRPHSGKYFPTPDLKIEVSAGLRVLELKKPILDTGVGGVANIQVEYGDRFEGDSHTPYDYITFKLNLNAHSSQPFLGQLNIMGRLYSTELMNNTKDFLSLGMYQYYDYYDSDTISAVSSDVPYRFSTPASFGLGLIHKSNRPGNWGFNSFFHFNGILLGASLSDHYVLNDRDYNLGSGFGWKLGGALSYKDIFSVSLMNETFRLFTWKGYPENINWETVDERTLNAQGDTSQSTTHSFCLRFDLKVRKNLYLTSMSYAYTRNTNYRYFPDVFSQSFETRLLMTYVF